MLRINTTSKYAEFKSDTKSDLYPLNEISYTVENESETVSFYNRFYNKIMTEQISNIQVNDVPVTRDNIQELLSVLFASNEGGGGGGTVDLSNYYTKPETNTLLETKVDKVEGKQLSTEDYTTAEKTKLASLENYDDTTVKGDIAANTTAIEAEVERATAADTTLQSNINKEETRARTAEKELDIKVSTKVDKVEGKQLSTEDYTTEEKTKLASLENYDDTTIKGDIAANTAAIEAEVERAKAAESTIDYNLRNEVTRAKGAENNLDTKINTKADKDKYEKCVLDELSGDIISVFILNRDIKYHYIDLSEDLKNNIQIIPEFSFDKEIDEKHLFVVHNSSKTYLFRNTIIWKEKPTEMVDGATYEFIFTNFKSQNKVFAGYIKYE